MELYRDARSTEHKILVSSVGRILLLCIYMGASQKHPSINSSVITVAFLIETILVEIRGCPLVSGTV